MKLVIVIEAEQEEALNQLKAQLPETIAHLNKKMVGYATSKFTVVSQNAVTDTVTVSVSVTEDPEGTFNESEFWADYAVNVEPLLSIS